MKKRVSGIMLELLLTATLTLAFNIQPARSVWTGTVYIRADGSINPPDAPIVTYDNITYTLFGNISSTGDGIIAERDDIIIDGAGHTLQGTEVAESKGISLAGRSNVTIRNMNIKDFCYGIYLDNSDDSNVIGNGIEKNRCGICFLYSSKNNSIHANNIVANEECGIYLLYSFFNSIFKNNLTNNLYGIFLEFSCNNTIIGNNVANNQYGIWLRGSNDNKFHYNNFNGNSQQVFDWYWDHPFQQPSINVWNGGYPSGGNYWSNYIGIDAYSGPFQNETGSDGIGDTPYVIDENNMDSYPLMGMFYDFEVEWEGEKFRIEVISNATVSNLQVLILLDHLPPYLPCGQVFIQFFTEDTINATKFCRVTIPTTMLNGTYIVLIDLEEVPIYKIPNSNNTHAYLYFTYQHLKQKHEVIIVPEFPSSIILPLFTLTTLITTILLKKRKTKFQLP